MMFAIADEASDSPWRVEQTTELSPSKITSCKPISVVKIAAV